MYTFVMEPEVAPQVQEIDPIQSQPAIPLLDTPITVSTPPAPKNKSKLIIIIVGIVLVIAVLAFVAVKIASPKPKEAIGIKTEEFNESAFGSLTEQGQGEYEMFVVDSASETGGLAPAGATDLTKEYYRNTKASIKEAQEVEKRVGPIVGSIQIPDESIFIHTETYKGITIKWTAGQPISAQRLQWLKDAIDVLPEYFYRDHPVTNIISATREELGSQVSEAALAGAIAYASGLNIFLTKIFTEQSNQYDVQKKDAISTLFHEWTHVVQGYEVLQTFTEGYLQVPGNLIEAMLVSPFNKSYAKAAGWVFQYDEFGSSTYAILGTDSESQKNSEYGKIKYVEDMAEAFASLMTCNSGAISKARITWIETTIGKSASSFCPAKF